MNKTFRWAASAGVAALAFALNTGVASAQLQKAPAAKKVDTPKTAKTVKPKSACAAIKEEAGCTGDVTCKWVKAGKTKKGKATKAYCRTAPKAKAAKVKAPAKAKAKAKAKAPAAPKN